MVVDILLSLSIVVSQQSDFFDLRADNSWEQLLGERVIRRHKLRIFSSMSSYCSRLFHVKQVMILLILRLLAQDDETFIINLWPYEARLLQIKSFFLVLLDYCRASCRRWQVCSTIGWWWFLALFSADNAKILQSLAWSVGLFERVHHGGRTILWQGVILSLLIKIEGIRSHILPLVLSLTFLNSELAVCCTVLDRYIRLDGAMERLIVGVLRIWDT